MPENRWPASLLAALLGGVALLAAGCAQTPGAVDAQVDEVQARRMGIMFTTALPMGEIVRRIAAQEPRWPFQGSKGARQVSDAQVACVRAELTPEKISERQMQDARKYLAQHPQRAARDLQLLESGAAQTLGAFILSGATDQKSAANPKVSADEAKAMMELMIEPENQALREAMRLDSLSEAMFPSTPQSSNPRQRGRNAGRDASVALMYKPLFAAMSKCGLDFPMAD
ncbi:MAG: hypothetical protein LBP52_10760 [Burkholderiaceae bacterium]|jgi:hypothetical protein|nr:hypothetical protein [Burkholderiaceae bacterium]